MDIVDYRCAFHGQNGLQKEIVINGHLWSEGRLDYSTSVSIRMRLNWLVLMTYFLMKYVSNQIFYHVFAYIPESCGVSKWTNSNGILQKILFKFKVNDRPSVSMISSMLINWCIVCDSIPSYKKDALYIITEIIWMKGFGVILIIMVIGDLFH